MKIHDTGFQTGFGTCFKTSFDSSFRADFNTRSGADSGHPDVRGMLRVLAGCATGDSYIGPSGPLGAILK
jgi:hypothetical protein